MYVTKTCPPNARIPDGAYHAVIAGSSNAPRASATRFQLPSKTSTRSLWKSVAYRRPFANVTPRKIAPTPVLSTVISAFFDQLSGTVGVQARRRPSSQA